MVKKNEFLVGNSGNRYRTICYFIFFHRVYKLSILHWTKSQQCGVLIWLGSLIYVMKDCTICMAAQYNCHIKICMFYSFRTWTKHALNAFALFRATGSLHLFENFEQFNVYTHYSVFQWAVQSTEYSDFYVFCNVHCKIIMQHEPIKCALFKLILFSIFDVSYMFWIVLRMNPWGLKHAEDVKNWRTE